MKKAVGFHNVAIHQYDAINWAIAYTITRDRLMDFEDFTRAVVKASTVENEFMVDAARLLPLWPATGFGGVVTVVVSVLCLRGLVERIGADHRIVRAAGRAPGMRWVLQGKVKGERRKAKG